MKQLMMILLPFVASNCASATDALYDELNAALMETHVQFDKGDFKAAKPSLARILEIRDLIGHGADIGKDVNDVHFALAYARLFYVALLEGDTAGAQSAIEMAIKVNDVGGRFHMRHLSEDEKLLLTLQIWLAWERRGMPYIDLERVSDFYREEKVSGKSAE